MKYILSNKNFDHLRALCFTKTLFGFDFDGTLAKIVNNPDDARIDVRLQKLLTNLSLYANLVIVSGRSISDLRQRINIKRASYIGNHGIEVFGEKTTNPAKISSVCLDWAWFLKRNWVDKLVDPGLEIENKKFSISLHYRRSKSKKQAKALGLKLAAELRPLPRVIQGDCVLNLIPPGAPHLGRVFFDMMQKYECRSGLYVGDDIVDEDIFSYSALGISSIRVGKSEHSAAQFYIKKQSEVSEMLSVLVKTFKDTQG